jgi:hypothetical protein
VELAILKGIYQYIVEIRNMFFSLSSGSILYSDNSYADYNYDDDYVVAKKIVKLIAKKAIFLGNNN